MFSVPESYQKTPENEKSEGRTLDLNSSQRLKALELELHTKPESGRELEDRSRTPERVWYRCDAGSAAVDKRSFVLAYCTLSIRHIEPVNLEPELAILAELYRVICQDRG